MPLADNIRWVVWLGRYASDKKSEAPKGFLIEVLIKGRVISLLGEAIFYYLKEISSRV